MDSYVERQLSLIEEAIRSYELGVLNLNSLIQRVEALNAAIGSESLRDPLWPIISSMEEINAISLDERRAMTKEEAHKINRDIDRIRSVVGSFRRTCSSRTSNPPD